MSLIQREPRPLDRDVADFRETEKVLRKVLGGYNKTHLRQVDFPFSSVRDACLRAERLDATVGGDIPETNTSRVYLLWKAIAAKTLPSQLPIIFNIEG